MKTGARLFFAATLLVWASPARPAVDCGNRESEILHFCEDAPATQCDPDTSNETAVCSAVRPPLNNGCTTGDCAMRFLKTSPSSFKATLTVIVDNNVSHFDGSAPAVVNAVAMTVILDFGKKGVLSQTYQNTATPTVAPVDRFGVAYDEALLATEASIDDTTSKAHLINDFVFRGTEPDLATGIRGIFGITDGVPVVTKVGTVRFVGHGGDGLASFLQTKIKGAFVSSHCGNNVVDFLEACDGSDLFGNSCQSRGFSGGTLACLSDCSGFDTSACTP